MEIERRWNAHLKMIAERDGEPYNDPGEPEPYPACPEPGEYLAQRNIDRTSLSRVFGRESWKSEKERKQVQLRTFVDEMWELFCKCRKWDNFGQDDEPGMRILRDILKSHQSQGIFIAWHKDTRSALCGDQRCKASRRESHTHDRHTLPRQS